MMRNKIAEQDHDEAWMNEYANEPTYNMVHWGKKANCPGCAKINEWLEIAYREGWIDGNERGTDGAW
jgi:hypothetical protein